MRLSENFRNPHQRKSQHLWRSAARLNGGTLTRRFIMGRQYALKFTVEEVKQAEVFQEARLIVKGRNHLGMAAGFHVAITVPVVDTKGDTCSLSPGNIELIYEGTKIVRICVLKDFTDQE